RDHDLSDLRHGSPSAGSSQRSTRLIPVGLRPGHEVGRADMIERPDVLRLWWQKPSLAALAVLLDLLAPLAYASDETIVSLGTGELKGVYYPVGRAICEVVNQDLRTHGVRCSPETTPGSVYNIEALRSGELDFALVQSDLLFAAFNGKGAWLGHPF